MPGDLRVQLLGGLEVVGLEPHALGSRKARTLLARLAVDAPRPVALDELVHALWPHHAPQRAGDQVAVLVSRLRRVLGSNRIVRRDAGYVLLCDALDIASLLELAEEAARCLAAADTAAAGAAAGAALALARGPLLPEELDADWAAEPRRACERALTRARRLAAEAALLAGDPHGAAEAAVTALQDDPYDEHVVRVLMTACAETGRTARGLQEYERVRRRLLDELGVEPEAATQQLYLDLLRGAAARSPSNPPASLPGRAAELASLAAALTRSRGRPRPLLAEVVGEAGIGKSRLIETFAETSSLQGPFVVVGRCDEVRRDLPLEPVVEALRSALARLDQNARTAVLAHDAEVLESLLAMGGGADRPVAGGGRSSQVVSGALVGVLRRLGRRAGAVLVLDDVHLADAATSSWLAHLRAQPGPPLLVVVARRVEEPVALRADVTVPLGPLAREAAAAVVGPERADELWERSGGHPLFLTELAHSPPGALPSSLVAAVGARAERCGEARGTLQAAAALGPVTDVDVLVRATGRAWSVVLDHLEEGVRRRLLVEEGASFRFPHEVVRAALAAGTSGSRRAWLHRTAAEALAGRTDADPGVLAFHARLAGDPGLTARALSAAATLATRRWQHESAAALLDEAAALDPTPDLRRRRALALLHVNRYAEAAQDAAAAFAAQPTAESYEVLAQTTYYDERDFARAAALADEAAARAPDEVARLRCLALAGRALHSAGQLPLAQDRLLAALGAAATPAVPDVQVSLGMVRLHQGRAAEALALTEPVDQCVDQVAFAPVIATMLRALAFALAGRPLHALAELDRCTRMTEERQVTRYGGRPDNCRGYVLRNLGALQQADEWNRAGLEKGTALAHPEPQAHALLDLADAALERSRPEEALALLADAEARESGAHSQLWRHAMRRRLLTCRVLLATGRAAQAAELADALLVEAEQRQVDRYVVLARLLRDTARHRAGRPVDAAAVEADLGRLGEVAGMDAWRTTADVASCFGHQGWRRLAEARVEALALRSGTYGEGLRRHAAARTPLGAASRS